MTANRARGFTLIELVVVITILGILAAFAVPKFITLDTSARTATINGLAGSVRSAASLARGMAMATQSTTSVTMEGATVALLNSYPDATTNGIIAAVNSSTADFTAANTGGASGSATWQKVNAPTPSTCSVTYAPPTAAGNTPTITVATGGC